MSSFATPQHDHKSPANHQSSIFRYFRNIFASPAVKPFEDGVSSVDLKDKIQPAPELQTDKLVEDRFHFLITHKYKFLLGLAVIMILIFGLAFLIQSTKSTAQTISETDTPISPSTSLNTKTISLSDSYQKGQNNNIYFLISQIKNKQQNGRTLQETTTQLQITYKDAKTKIIVSFRSKRQGEISIPINSILEFILTNQKRYNSTNEDLPPKQLTFLSIRDLTQLMVKEELVKLGATDIRISNERYMDGTYNKDKDSFTIIGYNSLSPSDQTINGQKLAELIDPVTISMIDNLSDETQIAAAVTKVVITIVQNIRKVLANNQKVIEEASSIRLAENDPSNGETSLYLDSPTDLLNCCTRTDDASLRCTVNCWNSGLLSVADSPKAEEVSVIVIKMTL